MGKADLQALETYVRAALRLQGYALNEEQLAEVLVQFGRIEELMRVLDQWPLAFDSVSAPVFRP